MRNTLVVITLCIFCQLLKAQVAVLPSFQAAHYKPPAYPDNLVTNGLILHLDASNSSSYPESGTVWYDLSGNGAHNTLNGPVWNADGQKSYFLFDGSNDIANSYDISQAYKDIMIAMYSESVVADKIEMVFSQYGNVDLSFRTSGGIFRHTGTYAPNAQDWNSGTTDRDFVNGAFISTNPSLVGSWNIVRLYRNSSSFRYSLSSAFDAYGTGYRYYKGRIAIVLCYNRELTQAEVLQNYNFLKSRFGL